MLILTRQGKSAGGSEGLGARGACDGRQSCRPQSTAGDCVFVIVFDIAFVIAFVIVFVIAFVVENSFGPLQVVWIKTFAVKVKNLCCTGNAYLLKIV